MKKLIIGLIFIALVSLLIMTQYPPSPVLTHLQGSTMGTTYSVQMVDMPSAINSQSLHQDLKRLLSDINGLMSTYQKDSELSRFNQNTSTDWVEVSPALLYVVDSALQFSQRSQGAFDITVGPLVNLWGFGPAVKAQQIPSANDIATAKTRTGYQHLKIRHDPPALKKARADLYMDLSAIAKGYAVDKIAEYLEKQGIQHYLVDIGGELHTSGHNAEHHTWRVAIEQPTPGLRAVQKIVEAQDMGVATSGSYRNFFQLQGQRFSHTIDPHTGWPVKHRLVSTTVLHSDTMHADAWATTFMVLGMKQALIIAEQEKLAVFLLEDTDTGVVEHYSSAFASLLIQEKHHAGD